MTKVLFITNKIPHYRLPLYELLADNYDLTIAHTGTQVHCKSFDEVQLKVKNIGPFQQFVGGISPENFDVVIIYLNARLLNLYKLLLMRNRKFRLVAFGAGVSASYTKRYDADKLVSYITKRILKRVDAAIFYDIYPVVKYSSLGIVPGKLFAAHNTVVGYSGSISTMSKRNSLLFIGTLYHQKGIGQILETYQAAKARGIELPILNIIGDGPDKGKIEEWIQSNELSNKIHVHGRITDESELSVFFHKAILCVSPGQAGLSVQKSFSYGVPFVTSYYPISGGEFTSIIDEVTGFYYDGTTTNLLQVLTQALDNPHLEKISTNCKVFYDHFRTPEIWVRNFSKAIDYSMGKVA